MTTPHTDEVARYAAAVRLALEDLPGPEREELLEDLDDHLAEVAAESPGVWLDERLGPPTTYAAELRAAYGARSEAPRGRRRLWDRLAALRGSRPYRQAAEFVPELRPAWWVVRGYVAAMLVFSVLRGEGEPNLLPDSVLELALAIAAIWGSVWLSLRTRAGRVRARWPLVAGNVFAVLAGLYLVSVHDGGSPDVGLEPRQVVIHKPVRFEPGEVANIHPYSRDGKPLQDVLLYDQDGRPILLEPEMHGWVAERVCGHPANMYPLKLVPYGEEPPPACISPSPTATPAPTPSPAR